MLSPRPQEDLARDLLLPPLPPTSLQRGEASPVADLPPVTRRVVSLGDLLDGTVQGVVTSACRVQGPAREQLIERAIGLGDRRDVLLGAGQPLRGLDAGTRVVAPDLRSVALLRSHYPDLVPLPSGTLGSAVRADVGSERAAPEIRPLWPDPGIESAGELLEPDSWLPEPGQGVAVLLHTPGSAHLFRDVVVDPEADAVLQAERAVGRAFPFAVPLVRAQLFGEWLSVHGIVLSSDGHRAVRARVRGDREDPVGVAERLVDVLMARGGDLLRPPEWTESASGAAAI